MIRWAGAGFVNNGMPGYAGRIMREIMLAHCRRCGAAYMSGNRRRLFCCERCRRSFQDERRKRERADAAERERKARTMRKREPLAKAGCPFLAMDEENACLACLYGEQCGMKRTAADSAGAGSSTFNARIFS